MRPGSGASRTNPGIECRTAPNDREFPGQGPRPCQSKPKTTPRRLIPEARRQASQHQAHPQDFHKHNRSRALDGVGAIFLGAIVPAVGAPAALPPNGKRRTSFCYKYANPPQAVRSGKLVRYRPDIMGEATGSGQQELPDIRAGALELPAVRDSAPVMPSHHFTRAVDSRTLI